MRVVTSNRVDDLALRLAEAIGAARARDPLETVHFLVNDAPLRAWLKDTLAEQLGVVANVDFERVHTFVARRMRAADETLRVLSSEGLRSLVLRALEDITVEPELAPVATWLRDEATGEPGTAAFQLAGRVAGLFDRYAADRPTLLRAWREGRVGDDETARWQAALYRRVFDADGFARVVSGEEGAEDPETSRRWMLLGEALGCWTPEASELPSALHVFAVSPAERGARRLMERLAEHTDLCVYHLDPADGSPALDTVVARWGGPFRTRAPLSRTARDAGTLPQIEIASAPAPEREMSWVADRVWRCIERDDSLRFNQVGVLVAARDRAPYLAHATVAFDRAGRLPVDRVGSRSSGAEGLVDAMQTLLRLPELRFGRDELFGILAHPNLNGGRLDEARLWQAWASSLNVRFGVDSAHLASTYLVEDHEVFHWDQALRRLALGAFMTGPESGDEEPFEVEGRRWLPHEVCEDDVGAAGRLLEAVRALAEDRRRMETARLSLSDWGAWFAELARRYLRPDRSDPDDDVRAVYREVLDAMYGLRRADVDRRPVSHALARRFAAVALSGVGSGGESYHRSGVAIGGLSTLRGLPFQVLFVVGLGSEFPAHPYEDPLDLLRDEGEPGRAERDRYLLLEALFSARERIYLSYPGVDPITGVVREPSLAVRELQESLPQSAWTRVALGSAATVGLSRFNRTEAVSSGVTQLRRIEIGTAVPQALEDMLGEAPDDAVAIRDALGLCAPVPDIERTVEGGAVRRLSLTATALREFIECPLQASAKRVLRLYDDQDEVGTNDDEPLGIDRMSRAVLARKVFWAARGDPSRVQRSLDALMDQATLRGSIPVGPFALPVRDELYGIVDAWAAHLHGIDLDGWAPYRFGRADEFADEASPDPPIVLEATIQGVATRVELHGGTEFMAPTRTESVHLVAGRWVGDKDPLRGVFSSILAVAAGAAEPGEHDVRVAGRNLKSHVYSAPTRDEALDWLRGLVESLFNHKHPYLLPYDIVARYHAKGAERVTAEIERGRETGRLGSSRFGPVRQPARFPPPEDIEALLGGRLSMILERLGGAR